jgi:UDP-N-acetylglucosamine 2-epimerase (non-hydrolysing)
MLGKVDTGIIRATKEGIIHESFKVSNVTLRDVTERPEPLECGSNMLTGTDPEIILQAVGVALSSSCGWTPPAECLESDVASTVAKIVLGHYLKRH